MDLELDIQGKYASVISKTIEVRVEGCTNSTEFSVPCAPQSEIDQLFANETNFFYTIYFINPLINPDSEDFLSYYLEDLNYVMFSATAGEECQLFMEDYHIETDESILPLAETRTDEGGIVTKNCIKNRYTIDPTNPEPLYATFFIYKSPISKSIERSFQKIDEILSYIGGLFGTIAICFFFVNIYNSYSFEITMGGYLFKPDDEQMGKRLKKYNFLYFLLHLCYVLTDAVGLRCSWPTTKLYYECREEMVKQLDILYLVRRVTFLERALGAMLSEKQLRTLHLVENRTLAEAKKDRRKFRWNDETFLYKFLERQKQPAPFSGHASELKELELVRPRDERFEAQGGEGNRSEPSPTKLSQGARLAEAHQHPEDLEFSSDSESEGDSELDHIVREVGSLKKEALSEPHEPLSRRIWHSLGQKVQRMTENRL
jgi:hypothetical protein